MSNTVDVQEVEFVSVDAGRNRTKVFNGVKFDEFLSFVGEWRPLKNGRNLDRGDTVIEVEGNKHFVGGLAKQESEYGIQNMSLSKAHYDTKVLVLTAIARLYYGKEDVSCVVFIPQPIGNHDEGEKKKLQNIIKGTHEIAINRKKMTIKVVDCMVSAEGVAVKDAVDHNEEGAYHVIDVGSTTVNVATIACKRVDGEMKSSWIDRFSFTEFVGVETMGSYNSIGMSRLVSSMFNKRIRSPRSKVYLVGGEAENLLPSIKSMINAEIVVPEVDFPAGYLELFSDGDKPRPSAYLNTVGTYKAGVKAYGQKKTNASV